MNILIAILDCYAEVGSHSVVLRVCGDGDPPLNLFTCAVVDLAGTATAARDAIKAQVAGALKGQGVTAGQVERVIVLGGFV